MSIPPIDQPWIDSTSDRLKLAAMNEFADRTRAAGITSDQFPSKYPIGSVLDEVSARPERVKVLGLARVKRVLTHAEHFLLDEDAGAKIVQTVEHHATLISELRHFAIMPYPVMTITMPTRATHDADRESLLLVEEREGFKQFALALRHTTSGDVVAVPGWYGYANDPSGKSRTVFRTDGPPMPDDAVLRQQIGTYSIALDAVLLYLNQKKGVHISEPTLRRRSMLRGRPTTFFSRSTIRLTLDSPTELRHHFTTGAREAARRHAVRGHFFHRGGDVNCTHRWAGLDGHENAWECVDCERRRFWRRDFERGDADKGYVASRYLIGVSE